MTHDIRQGVVLLVGAIAARFAATVHHHDQDLL
jgi:hypothetical protein